MAMRDFWDGLFGRMPRVETVRLPLSEVEKLRSALKHARTEIALLNEQTEVQHKMIRYLQRGQVRAKGGQFAKRSKSTGLECEHEWIEVPSAIGAQDTSPRMAQCIKCGFRS